MITTSNWMERKNLVSFASASQAYLLRILVRYSALFIYVVFDILLYLFLCLIFTFSTQDVMIW